MDSKREKWKLMYWATWKNTHTHTQKESRILIWEVLSQEEAKTDSGDSIHTSLLISSVSLSMRKMRAFFLDGPCMSLCSSGMSVFFSRLCSANENKNELSGVCTREKEER